MVVWEATNKSVLTQVLDDATTLMLMCVSAPSLLLDIKPAAFNIKMGGVCCSAGFPLHVHMMCLCQIKKWFDIKASNVIEGEGTVRETVAFFELAN